MSEDDKATYEVRLVSGNLDVTITVVENLAADTTADLTEIETTIERAKNAVMTSMRTP